MLKEESITDEGGDVRLVGIDLAWSMERNPSALAVALLSDSLHYPSIQIETVHSGVVGFEPLTALLESVADVQGLAIDAPLIIHNPRGMRECERELAKDYASRRASCHPTNLALYPNAASVLLADYLVAKGYLHLDPHQWQFECYPHPAMVEMFGLVERLLYKKGAVDAKRQGQIKLATLIQQLQFSPVLALKFDKNLACLNTEHISKLRGQALKNNEDALDAIICVYICGLYALNVSSKSYGDIHNGYIWVPQTLCI